MGKSGRFACIGRESDRGRGGGGSDGWGEETRRGRRRGGREAAMKHRRVWSVFGTRCGGGGVDVLATRVAIVLDHE
ncbi:hypothetical protein B296_00014496 [Ensete ventricosum]|uniref:Uncharacterized protein n=1 Tax=Ensete ventricosum TaxID=4639 RepID=A0A426ZN49_ENSVE|nr:hypothetical protein B296_00014496 [Ensete ventricosum]